MLQSDFVLILYIGAWILGAVLAAKLTKRMRVTLNYLFIPVYIVIIIAVLMTAIWVLGSIAGGYGGPPSFIIPTSLASVLISFMLGYHWTRFLAIPFKTKTWLFVFIAMLPVLLNFTLYAAALINSIQLRQNERTAIREGVQSCVFNTTKLQLPDMPNIACTPESISFDTLQKFQTKDKNNQAFHRKRRKRRNYKLSNSNWFLNWQGKCKENKIEDLNCSFIPAPISFKITKSVYSNRIAKDWGEANRFHLNRNSATTFYENSRRFKSFEELLSKAPLSPGPGIKTWVATPKSITWGNSKEASHFTKGIRCYKSSKHQRSENEYQCTAVITLSKDLHAAFEPVVSINLENKSYITPIGVSFSYGANNIDEVVQGFTEGETALHTYINYLIKTYVDSNYVHVTPKKNPEDFYNEQYRKRRRIDSYAEDIYKRCKTNGLYINLGEHRLYYPRLVDLEINQSARKDVKDKCINPVDVERPPVDELSSTITYYRERLNKPPPLLTVSLKHIGSRVDIFTKHPKSECGENRPICSRITRIYRENKYKNEKQKLPPFTSERHETRQFVTGNFPHNPEYSWTPQSSSGPNIIDCRKSRLKHKPDVSYSCNFSYMIEQDIPVYARFITYVSSDNLANLTNEIENVILRVEEDWTKLKTDATKQTQTD